MVLRALDLDCLLHMYSDDGSAFEDLLVLSETLVSTTCQTNGRSLTSRLPVVLTVFMVSIVTWIQSCSWSARRRSWSHGNRWMIV